MQYWSKISKFLQKGIVKKISTAPLSLRGGLVRHCNNGHINGAMDFRKLSYTTTDLIFAISGKFAAFL